MDYVESLLRNPMDKLHVLGKCEYQEATYKLVLSASRMLCYRSDTHQSKVHTILTSLAQLLFQSLASIPDREGETRILSLMQPLSLSAISLFCLDPPQKLLNASQHATIASHNHSMGLVGFSTINLEDNRAI